MRTQNEITSLKLVQDLYAQFNIKTELSPNQYDHYDIQTEHNWLLEVKARRLDYNQFISYNKDGFIMENLKYNFLSQYKQSRYINVFDINGNKFILNWRVNEIEQKIQNMNCKSTTDFNNNSYKKKEIILLKAQDAIIYLVKGEKFIRVEYNELLRNIC